MAGQTNPIDALDGGVVVADPAPNIGGYRGTNATARFTAQLVALVLPDRKERVVALTRTHRMSQARVMRAVIDHGLACVEDGLRDGTIDPEQMA